MNAASRALAQGSFTGDNVKSMVLSPRSLLSILLVVALILTGCVVVYVKDMNRRLFYELQTAQQVRDELNMEQGQLLIEQNTWATPQRVQEVAQVTLSMVVPASQAVDVVGQ